MVDTLIQRYKAWFSKKVENIKCTKGAEGQQFTCRFQTLPLTEGALGVYHHVSVIYRLAKEFDEERRNLNWVEKLVEECDGWKLLFESVLYSSSVDQDQIIDSLVKGGIDCETAVDLV